MFDFFRNHTRLALGFILLLIVPSFVFFGVDGYTSFRDGSSASVAQADGVSITRGEWESAHQRVIDRIRRQNPEQDARSLDTNELRAETLNALLRERVTQAAARSMQLAPTDARLKRLFASDPQFASVRNPDGTVNREILGMQGMTSELFAQRLQTYWHGIIARCRHPLNTSVVEGINNTIKVIKRRAYGYRDEEYFFLKIRAAFPGIPR
jgi:peptidyl-prolyl cis-trans isomerase D